MPSCIQVCIRLLPSRSASASKANPIIQHNGDGCGPRKLTSLTALRGTGSHVRSPASVHASGREQGQDGRRYYRKENGRGRVSANLPNSGIGAAVLSLHPPTLQIRFPTRLPLCYSILYFPPFPSALRYRITACRPPFSLTRSHTYTEYAVKMRLTDLERRRL